MQGLAKILTKASSRRTKLRGRRQVDAADWRWGPRPRLELTVGGEGMRPQRRPWAAGLLETFPTLPTHSTVSECY